VSDGKERKNISKFAPIQWKITQLAQFVQQLKMYAIRALADI
jgi:hypothetical protein